MLPKQSSHHLEEQMHEGEMFLSYFKKTGVEYLPGGIESGFKIVTEKVFVPRLLHVKGERYPRVFEVPIKADSINDGDCFILDMNDKIFFWKGEFCNVNEKMKALEVCTNMRKSERHCHADILFPNEDEKVDQEFWGHLGGKPAKINPPTPDDAAEGGSGEQSLWYKLYKVSNETGKLLCSEITERPLRRDHLDSNDTFILEVERQVLIWIGKNANVEEKKNALIIGKGFVQKNNKPKGTRVTRITEGCEDSYFKSFFNGFYPILKVDHGGPNLDKSITAQQDMAALANQKKVHVANLLTDLGKYTVAIYLIGEGRN